MSNAVTYWLFAGGFFVTLLGVGVVQFAGLRGVDDNDERAFDYWIGTGSLPGWWIAASLAAGWLLIGWMTWQMYLWYIFGLGAIWIFTIPWVLCTVGLVFVPKLFRRFPGTSIPEILRFRYSQAVQTLLGPIQSFVFLSWLAAEVFVLSTALSVPLETSPELLAVVVSVVFGVYVILGGFRSVLRTDLIQFVLASGLLIALTVGALSEAASIAGGFGNIIGQINQNPPAFADGFFDWDSPGLGYMLLSIIIYTPGFVVLQGAWQRVMSAKNVNEAQKGMYWNLAFNVGIVVLLPTLIGIATLVIFPPVNGEVASEVGTFGYFIFTSLITELFGSPIIGGVLILSLMGMALSSVDTYVNVCAMNISRDVLDPLVYERYDVSGKQKLIIGRLLVGVFIISALAWAFVFPGLFDIYFFSTALLTATTAIAVFAAFSDRTTTLAVYLGIIFGGVSTFVFFGLQQAGLNGWEPSLIASSGLGYGLWGLLFGIVGFIIGMRFGDPPSGERLSIYDTEYYSGRSEMFEQNKQLKRRDEEIRSQQTNVGSQGPAQSIEDDD